MERSSRPGPLEPNSGSTVKIPNPSPSPGRRRRLAALIILASAAGGLALVALPHLGATPPAVQRSAGFVRLTEGSLQYTFHLVTGSEALFDLSNDPKALRNLAARRPEDLVRMRLRLIDDLGVKSLDDLRAPHRKTIERLEALGYL